MSDTDLVAEAIWYFCQKDNELISLEYARELAKAASKQQRQIILERYEQEMEKIND